MNTIQGFNLALTIMGGAALAAGLYSLHVAKRLLEKVKQYIAFGDWQIAAFKALLDASERLPAEEVELRQRILGLLDTYMTAFPHDDEEDEEPECPQ
jgi:hypothetical protein